MGINLKLYFKSNSSNLFFYFLSAPANINLNQSITFQCEECNYSNSSSIRDFIKNGAHIIHNFPSMNTIKIISTEDVLVGCDHSKDVYRLEGSLPYLGGRSGIISNFDKTCLPLFDTSKLLMIDDKLLSNNKSVKTISYLFSDHREWRIDYSEKGNQLQHIPDRLLEGFDNSLIELNSYMTRMDNILTIPRNHLSHLNKLRAFRGFNDCPKLSDIQGAKLVSSNLGFIVAFNDLPSNILIPSNLINSGGNGNLMIYSFNNIGHPVKPIAFDNIINAPEKVIGFMSDIHLKYSKVNSITNSRNVIEFGNFNIESITNDETLVNTWKEFYNSKVLPNIMNKNDLSGVRNIYTKTLQ